MYRHRITRFAVGFLSLVALSVIGMAALHLAQPRAYIDGTGPDWKTLGEADFANVNCDAKTWTWKDGLVHCSGQPVGVTRTKKTYTNFEIVAEWRHLQSGGNSGIFVWASEASLEGLKPGTLPRGGIEVQVPAHFHHPAHLHRGCGALVR